MPRAVGCLVAGTAGYAIVALFIARMLSSKWHPDGGRGVEDSETHAPK